MDEQVPEERYSFNLLIEEYQNGRKHSLCRAVNCRKGKVLGKTLSGKAYVLTTVQVT